ncbi:helix-turn-helix domain-containing protein [Catellatospora bangladeshensis]|uniref:HTH cro/C1-type domain-containing protein n=1 Tax=Catellatospora bangladeshensis TaxID=310355 RepID=A0A8J3NMR9_9ACTN|nr:helix-turn-helix transcriptional regulator [Catellatospora bangladeshensis]GIF86230.1 hypothetical protein Cba03nite_75790 [Catellatospora bangladeshensis]
MSSAGRELQRWRKRRRLSLRALAEKVNYSYVYLWEIERGGKPALAMVMAACDRALEAGGELARLAEKGGDVKRREFLQSTVAAPLMLRGALSGLNDQLWKVYVAASDKSSLLPLANAQLVITDDDLMRADVLQLIGEIYFDGNRYSDAVRCYTEAATAASGTNADHDLWACALIRHAFVGVYERRFADALRLLELAEGVAARGDSQLTTSPWVQVVKAQALAGLGDASGCRRSLDLSHALDGRTNNGGWLRFDGSRIAEEAGACFIQLGRPDQAEIQLEQALAGLATSSRRRGVVLADLAMVGVMRKDREYALHYASGALSIARETGSGLLTRKLMNVQAEMLGAW